MRVRLPLPCATGLFYLAPETGLIAASRLFLREIQNRTRAKEDFAFETTLAGRSYLKLICRLQSEGWRVELLDLALPGADMSRLRVAERVAHGGHNLPLADIERHFPRRLRSLLNEFSYASDRTQCFMNDGDAP